jgi:glucuronate isomerase
MAGNTFIHEDFLLESAAARRLYHEFAESLPIIDYHCHLPPGQIAEDHRYQNMTDIWLRGDHYKWRAMRTNGVAERYCTGDAGDREKFEQWAATVPRLLRNPLYHWTHLELARYFNIFKILSPDTAREIWEQGNAQLAQPEFSSRGLMKRSRVALVCTTDDPVHTLAEHRAIAADPAFDVQVLPTWRPDKGMAVENPAAFNAWVDELAACTRSEIRTFGEFLDALRRRQAFFHECGCRLSDHGLEAVHAEDYTERDITAIFAKVRGGAMPGGDEILKFKSAMLYEFCLMNAEKGWTQQLHLGALRNNNTRLFPVLGPDVGFDSMADAPVARPLSKLLGRLDRDNKLAKTVLYNLNPKDNAVLATMAGNFQDGTVPGKIQYGSAWWFLDQMDGMKRQIEDLSQLGLLSRFVGMLTDSRSFLSYPRHEYFRRILCNLLGLDMDKGMIPQDFMLVGNMVRDICYNNAAQYFGFNLPVIK